MKIAFAMLFTMVSTQSSFAQFYFACYLVRSDGTLEEESSQWLMPYHDQAGVITSVSYGPPTGGPDITIPFTARQQRRFAKDRTFSSRVDQTSFRLKKSPAHDGHVLTVDQSDSGQRVRFVCYQDGTV